MTREPMDREAYREEVLDVPVLVDAITERFVSYFEHRFRPSRRWPSIDDLRAEVRANLTKNIDRIHPTEERKVDIGARIRAWATYEEWVETRGASDADRR